MKKFMIFVTITMMAIFTLAGCGDKSGSSVSTPEVVSSIDTDVENSSEDLSSETEVDSGNNDKEPSKSTSSGSIEDVPALAIELKDGKVFKYNGECFTDVYQQLCDLGIEKEVTKGEYAEKGTFYSANIEASNGTLFSISYLPKKQIFEIRTGEGVKNKTAWNLTCGPIDNTTLIADFVKMGATPIEEKNAHSDGSHIIDYYFESANFATKGVSINASGDGTLQEDDLVVRGIIIDYSGVEK